ncbi:histidine kinase [Mucilaginibacter sp. HMF5004]|uniref:sensor histidine kinase n=1 Tax=Mucilaginibacter rivuli TaxID=2857527 RepID=UPI001C5EEB7B|nr:histidine kinase [Mucilaginibacter rivuli]MBW4890978.1 histidine kinase [Mucilaginibacter rivuli]
MNTRMPSNSIKTGRIMLHIAFWVIVYVVFLVIYSVKSTYAISAYNGIFYMPLHMGYFYLIAYWLIPAYLLRSHYISFIFWVLCVSCAAAFAGRVIDILIGNPNIIKNLPSADWSIIEDSKQTFWQQLFNPYHFISSVKMMNFVIWIAVVIKLFKLWYERKQAAIQAELRALKGQVHPHFLFNTLNNLYALTLNQSPKAPGVVIGLSDMLRYMLYECNADKVNLKKEVIMLQHYMDLEKIRYEDRLEMNFNIDGNLDDKMIAPLMLLPLVENAFKHGTSEMTGDTWINIDLNVTGNKLKFKVSNSKPETVAADAGKHYGNIGIQNIKKRLELLYPSTYQLKIMDDEDVFLVMLELELTQAPALAVTQLTNS